MYEPAVTIIEDQAWHEHYFFCTSCQMATVFAHNVHAIQCYTHGVEHVLWANTAAIWQLRQAQLCVFSHYLFAGHCDLEQQASVCLLM
jgi:hypothetical protein